MPEIDIVLEDPAWTEDVADASGRAHQAAAAALAHCRVADASELAVVLADDRLVRDLNRRFRGQDKPTNVLAFPAGGPEPALGLAPGGWPLGDVVLARETCRREAEDQHKPLGDHLAHLVVHGVLHLCGRDHHAEDEAERMEAEERLILGRIGVADPYRDGADGGAPP